MAITAETKIGRRLFTVEEYYRMAEVGIIRPEDRVELIKGEILNMAAASGGRHSYIVSKLVELFFKTLNDRAVIRSQDSVRILPDSAPEPDVFLLKPPSSQYIDSVPTSEELILVIEVADISLHYDRNVKSRIYAENFVPEYWIVNVNERKVEIYRQPDDKKFCSVELRLEDDTVSPLAFPDVRLAVTDILGKKTER